MLSLENILAVLRRPDLWGESIRTLLAVTPRDWWRRRPFVPRPDPGYMAWRVATAHGDPESIFSSKELVAYLEWRKQQHGGLRRI